MEGMVEEYVVGKKLKGGSHSSSLFFSFLFFSFLLFSFLLFSLSLSLSLSQIVQAGHNVVE